MYCCICQIRFRRAEVSISVLCLAYIRSYLGLQYPLSLLLPSCAQVRTDSMKSGSTGGTQSHIAMSKVWYLLFGAEMALKVALSSMFCWVIEMPIFCRSDCMIWNVRSPVPRSSGGKMTLYCIGWPLAIRRPFGPIL